ncbi:MAG: hypothetical protein K0S58_2584 [Nitrospira sp.]|jgi:hypothetical protein|nr:hypothetical protein [Nitrospira sp.]
MVKKQARFFMELMGLYTIDGSERERSCDEAAGRIEHTRTPESKWAVVRDERVHPSYNERRRPDE